jgi:glycosyltransferase involved in cell wall biosynthesis
MEKTTAIICAFNEEKTIANVIRNISATSIISNIIVVNDGSTDNTGEIINHLRQIIDFEVIHLSVNRGKGYAMAMGVEQSNTNITVFIDADLSDLNENHLKQLLTPVLNNKADMVLGQPTNTMIHCSVNPFKRLAGQRALKKDDILPILEKMKQSGFGVETLINLHYNSKNKIIKYVILNNLTHPTKFQKTSLPQAVKEFIMEGHQIASTSVNNFDLVIKKVKNSISNF